ncbi:hypothetical protein [Facklamia sp. P13064]|uniref:hypothetical protein n=1 Tax=Facklamia sp. P13064 TaxID=3421953 RepID=UPI003D1749FD
MNKILTFLIQYQLISFYNGFIFNLQRIPLIGKIFSNKLYHSKFLLKWGPPLSVIFQMIKPIVTNIIFIALVGLLLPTFSNKYVESEEIMFLSYGPFYLSIVMLMMAVAIEIYSAFENAEDKYMHIKIFRVNPRFYSIANDLLKYGPKIVGFSIGMFLFSFIFKITLLEGFSFVIFSIGLRLFIRSIFLYLCRNNYPLGKKVANFLVFFTCGVGFLLAIVGTFIDLGFNYAFFFSVIFLAPGLLMLVLTIIFTLKTTYLEQFILKSLSINDLLESQQFVDEIDSQSAKVEDKDIRIGKNDYSDDQGIIYINKIFYDRIGSVFKKKILIRLAFIGITLVMLNVVKYFVPLSPTDVKGLSQFIPLILLLLARSMYLGEFFTKTSFYYMDRKLLSFHFYRAKENITTAIVFRTKQLLKYNRPQFIVALIGLLFTYYHWDLFDSQSVLVMVTSLISGYVFMTFHFLFAYYMFQPFTNQMKVKNPVYTGILNFVLYILYFSMVRLSSYTHYLVFGFFLFVILYVVLGIMIVYLFGPKRFRLR